MASITKRGPYQFQAQIRRKGYPNQQRTFETKREAEAWATDIESQMNRGTFVDRSEAERTTFGEALGRYAREVTQDKRGWETEMHRIKALQKHPLVARSLASLRSLDFANYRDERLPLPSRPSSAGIWPGLDRKKFTSTRSYPSKHRYTVLRNFRIEAIGSGLGRYRSARLFS